MSSQKEDIIGFTVVGSVVFGIICFVFWVIPQYNVYRARMAGEAILANAEASKKVLIEQAKAEKEAAVLRSEAIKIIGDVAKQYPEYREQEFIGAFAEALKEGKMQQVIYVPTEANVPIIESRNR